MDQAQKIIKKSDILGRGFGRCSRTVEIVGAILTLFVTECPIAEPKVCLSGGGLHSVAILFVTYEERLVSFSGTRVECRVRVYICRKRNVIVWRTRSRLGEACELVPERRAERQIGLGSRISLFEGEKVGKEAKTRRERLLRSGVAAGFSERADARVVETERQTASFRP